MQSLSHFRTVPEQAMLRLCFRRAYPVHGRSRRLSQGPDVGGKKCGRFLQQENVFVKSLVSLPIYFGQPCDWKVARSAAEALFGARRFTFEKPADISYDERRSKYDQASRSITCTNMKPTSTCGSGDIMVSSPLARARASRLSASDIDPFFASEVGDHAAAFSARCGDLAYFLGWVARSRASGRPVPYFHRL